MPKCVNGQNFGKYALSEKSLDIFYTPTLMKTPVKDDEKAIMAVDYEKIALVNATGKNEVSLEMKEPTDKSSDFVTEIRFYVQNNETAILAEEEDLTPARAFVAKINKKTTDEGADEIAKPLAELSELFMLVPRGKYDFTFLSESMRLHGKSFTY